MGYLRQRKLTQRALFRQWFIGAVVRRGLLLKPRISQIPSRAVDALGPPGLTGEIRCAARNQWLAAKGGRPSSPYRMARISRWASSRQLGQ